MKNKKGFTLVEMLVVLGIICVLALIITPAIISYRNKANNEYNDKLKDSVIAVAKEYYTNDKSKLPNGYPEGKYIDILTLNTMKQNNLISNDVIDAHKNNCSDDSYVVVENNRGNYDYYLCLKCGDKTYETDKSYCKFKDGSSNPPTCELTYNDNWSNKDVTINIKSTDVGEIIKIRNNGKTIKTTYDENTKTYNANFTAKRSGSYSFDIINNYGYKTTCKTENEIKIDRDSPSCSITKQDITNTSLNLFVDALDKTSGIKSIEMGEKTLGTDNLYKVTVNGKYVATVIDNAGNAATCEIVVDEFDKTPPVIVFGIEGTNGEIATSTCEDPESGIVGEAIVKQTLTGNKNVIVTRTCKNNVGLETTASHTYRYSTCVGGTITAGSYVGYDSCKYYDSKCTRYSCPKGYTLSGTTCTMTNTQCYDMGSATECRLHCKGDAGGYWCSGSKCCGSDTHTTSPTCTKWEKINCQAGWDDYIPGGCVGGSTGWEY